MRLHYFVLLIGVGLVSSSFGQDTLSKRSSPLRARRAIELTRVTNAASFFPLAVGNSWVYDVTGFAGGRPAKSQVEETRQFSGETYHRLVGQANRLGWVRLTDEGRLLQLNTETAVESLIYDFGGTVGSGWIPEGPAFCNGAARISERDEQRLVVEYLGGVCADAGVTRETLEAGIGLVSRREITIGGERRHDLREAFIGGGRVDRRGLTASLSLDKRVYSEGEPIIARLSVSNSTGDPLTLHFSSGQQFDFSIDDDTGTRVYLWSANKLFIQIAGEIQLDSGERFFVMEIPEVGVSGGALKPGQYSAAGWLTTAGSRTFGASVGFEIVASDD